jgi:hypothetical protein
MSWQRSLPPIALASWSHALPRLPRNAQPAHAVPHPCSTVCLLDQIEPFLGPPGAGLVLSVVGRFPLNGSRRASIPLFEKKKKIHQRSRSRREEPGLDEEETPLGCRLQVDLTDVDSEGKQNPTANSTQRDKLPRKELANSQLMPSFASRAKRSSLRVPSTWRPVFPDSRLSLQRIPSAWVQHSPLFAWNLHFSAG